LEQRREQDSGMAMLIQMLLNIHRDSEHRPQPFELHEILQWLGHTMPAPAPPPRKTAEELTQAIELLHGFYRQAEHTQGYNGALDH
jgi:hypothetical protein